MPGLKLNHANTRGPCGGVLYSDLDISLIQLLFKSDLDISLI